MIIDRLQHAACTAGPGPNFAGMDSLRSGRPETDAEGRDGLDGERVVAIVQSHTTRSADGPEAVWEAHRRYADVQYVVTGREQLGVAPLEAMSETQPYDPERDVALYEGEGTLVALRPGSVAVLFPQEVHMPVTPLGDPAEVRKVVIKVEVTSPGL